MKIINEHIQFPEIQYETPNTTGYIHLAAEIERTFRSRRRRRTGSTCARLKQTFSRIESSWLPATQEESYEIVCRRLFWEVSGEKAQHRFTLSFRDIENEKTNGFIRQHSPKNRDLTTVTEDEVEQVMHQLNHRPRKTLEFRTPFEVFFKTRSPLTFALQS